MALSSILEIKSFPSLRSPAAISLRFLDDALCELDDDLLGLPHRPLLRAQLQESVKLQNGFANRFWHTRWHVSNATVNG